MCVEIYCLHEMIPYVCLGRGHITLSLCVRSGDRAPAKLNMCVCNQVFINATCVCGKGRPDACTH